jgi:hypothetical protein
MGTENALTTSYIVSTGRWQTGDAVGLQQSSNVLIGQSRKCPIDDVDCWKVDDQGQLLMTQAEPIGTRTLMGWLQIPEFQAAYRQARMGAFAQSIARLQQASSAAASVLLKVMLDPPLRLVATPAKGLRRRAARSDGEGVANRIAVSQMVRIRRTAGTGTSRRRRPQLRRVSE